MTPRYGPPDATLAPRYTGVRTFARLPHVTDPDGVDAAVVGVPFDTAASFPPGALLGRALLPRHAVPARGGGGAAGAGAVAARRHARSALRGRRRRRAARLGLR